MEGSPSPSFFKPTPLKKASSFGAPTSGTNPPSSSSASEAEDDLSLEGDIATLTAKLESLKDNPLTGLIALEFQVLWSKIDRRLKKIEKGDQMSKKLFDYKQLADAVKGVQESMRRMEQATPNKRQSTPNSARDSGHSNGSLDSSRDSDVPVLELLVKVVQEVSAKHDDSLEMNVKKHKETQQMVASSMEAMGEMVQMVSRVQQTQGAALETVKEDLSTLRNELKGGIGDVRSGVSTVKTTQALIVTNTSLTSIFTKYFLAAGAVGTVGAVGAMCYAAMMLWKKR